MIVHGSQSVQTHDHATPGFPQPLARTRLLTSQHLSQEEQDALERAVSSTRDVRAGTDLVREGERADGVFVFAEGWGCRYTTTRDGARQLPALLVPGDVGNLDSLMFDRLDYGVRTLTRSTIVSLPRDRALALAAEHPGIARVFTWLAMVENTTLSKWVLSLGRRTSRDRVAHLLCELNVRLGGNEKGESSFAFPLTQEIIGDVLGLTSVHVNRMMQHLRNEGLIAVESRVMTLLDVERLHATCGFDPRYLHVDPTVDVRRVQPGHR